MRYHNITTDDMKNGDGLRTVLWVAGCNHGCKGCQNPVTWDPNDGLEFDSEAIAEFLKKTAPDYISGVTFSGGDPLYPDNREDVWTMASAVKALFPDKTVWVYTGYLWEDVKDLPLMQDVDVLVDGPFIEGLKDISYPWAGSTNQRIIDVPASLLRNEVVLHG